jgi:hypothetical protein
MKSKLFESALQYCKQGFSIIPVGKNKKPLVQWQRYQKEQASEDQMKQWWKKWPTANIGIVTGDISGLAVIDIDEVEVARESLQDLITDSLIMPIANTPSGGQHLYFRCPDNKLSNNTRIVQGCDLRANGGYIVVPPSSNGNGNSYAWQKGLSIHDIALPDMPQAYLSFIKKSFIYSKQNSISPQTSTTSTDVHTLFNKGSRDNDLFHVANSLIKGGMNESTALQVLKILANNCIPPFPESEIANKIQSALSCSEKSKRNLAHEVREFVLSTNGHFMSTEVHNCLEVSTRQEKKNVSETLRRLCDDGVLEKYGNKHGHFRRVENETEEIDFLNANDSEIKLALPFRINKFVNIYPKNIIVVAGSPDAGKTAFLLNIAEMNMSKYEIFYFSSEMAEQELKLRLSKFNKPLEEFKRVKWLERSTDFSDVIKPDAINIIDFLEVHEDFWRVGLMIKQIFDKLNKGIAIIALQKDKHKEYGTGATRSLEKARLYITMNPGQLRIEKAKNWADPNNNPNGLMLKYKLYQGCQFSPIGDWHK